MKTKNFKYFIGDFETTVFKGQTFTEVWASAVVEMHTEDVLIFHSIDDTYNYLSSLKENVCIYYHNLKFDGSFWLSFLLNKLHLKQAFEKLSDKELDIHPMWDKDMPNNSFNYNINSKGQWYSITIKINNKVIQIRDSLKLLPFSVEAIGKNFGTKHHKLSMAYEGNRYAGCEITDEEKEYIKNDVLVVKEALEIMFDEGHQKLTIGACCLSEFRSQFFQNHWEYLFPDLSKIELNPDEFDCNNVDEYIRKSYHGGWCYIVPEKAGIVYSKAKTNFISGITADVNSLYPSVMHSESGNYYPVGKPMFWKGKPPACVRGKGNGFYFFIRIRTRFYLKKNKLPCIQIKNNLLYNGREWLTTSDVYHKEDGKYYKFYTDFDGNIVPAKLTLTLTQTDYQLIKEHYNLSEVEYLDGCYFKTEIGLFDDYINKYRDIKIKSKGAKRTLAKLFLNNLYGKFATSTDSSFKYAELSEDNVVKFYEVQESNKKPVYIPIGSAITSYARNFTIRTAQKNYYGADKPGFIYADTDSIHCDLLPIQLKGVTVHPSNFLCWKLEATWDEAIFTRQKTYIEHVIEEDLDPCFAPYYNVKCAGMPEKCKQLFLDSLLQLSQKEWDEMYEEMHLIHPDMLPVYVSEEEEEFVSTPRTLENFEVGLKVPSKLQPKTILGGVLLTETTYEMRAI